MGKEADLTRVMFVLVMLPRRVVSVAVVVPRPGFTIEMMMSLIAAMMMMMAAMIMITAQMIISAAMLMVMIVVIMIIITSMIMYMCPSPSTYLWVSWWLV